MRSVQYWTILKTSQSRLCQASISDKAAEDLLDIDAAKDFSWESNRELPLA